METGPVYNVHINFVSDSDHLKLNATIFSDRIVETHHESDAARGLRKVQVTTTWRTVRHVGRGGFGVVVLQEKEGDPTSKRALKSIRQFKGGPGGSSDVELKAYIELTKPKYREAAVFVDFYGWFQDDNTVYLAMEYMPLGDLEYNLRSLTSGSTLPEDEVKQITSQTLEGLKIMHAAGFAHRDLKPQNIFVVQKHPHWWVKLGDFGLSKRADDDSGFRTVAGTRDYMAVAGTRDYMAPEVTYYLEDTTEGEYTNAVDLWALGCVVFRIVTGSVPFPPGARLLKYCKDQTILTFDKSLFPSTEIIAFVQSLLTPDPAGRPSASAALNHPWVVERSETPPRITDLSNPDDTDSFSHNTVSQGGRVSSAENSLEIQIVNCATTGSAYGAPSLPAFENAQSAFNHRGAQRSSSRETVGETVASECGHHGAAQSNVQVPVPQSEFQLVQSEIREPEASGPPKVPEGWKAKWNEFTEEWVFMNIYTKETQRKTPTEPFYSPLRDTSHIYQPRSHSLSTTLIPKLQVENLSLSAIAPGSNAHEREKYDQRQSHVLSHSLTHLSSHPSSYISSHASNRPSNNMKTQIRGEVTQRSNNSILT